GTAGQRIAVSAGNGIWSYVSILKPDLTLLVPSTFALNSLFIDTTTLPISGTYTIVFDPDGTRTGAMDFVLYMVAPDVIGSIVADGQTLTSVSLSTGQNAVLTFSGTANQRVSLAGNGTIVGQVALACDVTVTIVRQSDNQSFGSACMEGTLGFIDAVT